MLSTSFPDLPMLRIAKINWNRRFDAPNWSQLLLRCEHFSCCKCFIQFHVDSSEKRMETPAFRCSTYMHLITDVVQHLFSFLFSILITEIVVERRILYICNVICSVLAVPYPRRSDLPKRISSIPRRSRCEDAHREQDAPRDLERNIEETRRYTSG